MTTTAPAPVPATSKLLANMKHPKKASRFDKFEKVLSIAFFMFAGIILVAIAAKLFEMDLSSDSLRLTAVLALFGMYLAFGLWLLILLAQMGLALKHGFAGRANDIDKAIDREQALLTSLQSCCPMALAERGARLELEAKLLTRRYGLIAILVSAGAVAIRLHDAGGRAEVWEPLAELSMWIYAGSFGALVGALALASLTSQLDRVAHLLLAASKRYGA
ncbi:MAG: hypothetical protein ACREPV_08505 [Lysobacter sp.]